EGLAFGLWMDGYNILPNLRLIKLRKNYEALFIAVSRVLFLHKHDCSALRQQLHLLLKRAQSVKDLLSVNLCGTNVYSHTGYLNIKKVYTKASNSENTRRSALLEKNPIEVKSPYALKRVVEAIIFRRHEDGIHTFQFFSRVQKLPHKIYWKSYGTQKRRRTAKT
ncbi:hypothetical protein L9F63_021985, partial [Diploptera punctata]